MNIKTTRFGEIEAPDDLIFEFVDPILGYPEEKGFLLIEHSEKSDFKWLQSVKTPELAFVVAVAGLFGIDYSFELPDETQEKLGLVSAEEVLALNVVVIPHENPRKATINLLAPIIVNLTNRKSAQIILTGTDFKIDYPLFDRGVVC